MHKTSLAREKQGELFSLIAELDPAAILALLMVSAPSTAARTDSGCPHPRIVRRGGTDSSSGSSS